MTFLKKTLLVILLFFSSVAVAEVLLGTVIAVHDGDTITLRTETNKKKIRLAGIDAPELNQPYGFESRGALGEAVIDKQVQVEITKTDRYGRIVGKIKLNGQDINLQQVQLGLAWIYRKYLRELSKTDQTLYLEAEHLSKKSEVGLWKDTHPVAPWVWRQK